MPFQFIEYGIAQISAIIFHENEKNDSIHQVRCLKEMMRMESNYPVEAFYETLGVPFGMENGAIQQSAQLLNKRILSFEASVDSV
ncbi:hypothetical protein [Reichenbachiella sp.]|uniref:hypothetical protein n=1 Tax=Reichenbachiella sp. TaxID=2184521 RepID=UPI003B5CB2BE